MNTFNRTRHIDEIVARINRRPELGQPTTADEIGSVLGQESSSYYTWRLDATTVVSDLITKHPGLNLLLNGDEFAPGMIEMQKNQLSPETVDAQMRAVLRLLGAEMAFEQFGNLAEREDNALSVSDLMDGLAPSYAQSCDSLLGSFKRATLPKMGLDGITEFGRQNPVLAKIDAVLTTVPAAQRTAFLAAIQNGYDKVFTAITDHLAEGRPAKDVPAFVAKPAWRRPIWKGRTPAVPNPPVRMIISSVAKTLSGNSATERIVEVAPLPTDFAERLASAWRDDLIKKAATNELESLLSNNADLSDIADLIERQGCPRNSQSAANLAWVALDATGRTGITADELLTNQVGRALLGIDLEGHQAPDLKTVLEAHTALDAAMTRAATKGAQVRSDQHQSTISRF